MTTRNMTREQWLAERRTGIGGSDIAAILGLSPWRTAVDVWLDKTGRSGPGEETEAMRIGTELEDYVARRYAETRGRQVRRFTTMLRQGVRIGNIDRLVVPEGAKVASVGGEVRTDLALECKTASCAWPDGVPLHYQTQVQWYMGLAPSIAAFDVAALDLVHKAFTVHRVDRDDETIAMMSATAERWWLRHVEGGEMPPPSNESDCRRLWARSNPGKTVAATAELEARIESYRRLASKRDALEESMSEVRGAICAAMGDAERVADAAGRTLATWKSAKDRAATDWEALARELGATDAQIAAHTSAKPGARRFLLGKVA